MEGVEEKDRIEQDHPEDRATGVNGRYGPFSSSPDGAAAG